ncbi:MAG: alpha-L-fucosidase [Defluviitaleaceae bacterium]|nr:alpha-L-fucosidase [Defluviitaleaceae bacterium]
MYYKTTLESISKHTVPAWFEDAKLGIFIHWGMYSVPAWATPNYELGGAPAGFDWLKNNPYAEWYMNSLRIKGSPTYEHHAETYGTDFPYEGFLDMWKAEKWDPKAWAALLKKIGAKYIVPVTKHHDGLCLWNSRFTDYTTMRQGPKRDIVGELAAAVREEGIRFGVYYSGLLDWRFTYSPITKDNDTNAHENCTYAYADYAYNQFMELVNLFKPDILWNDIGWPEKGRDDLIKLFAYYYNAVPGGLVNDRWSGLWQDYTLREYQAGESDYKNKWENTRGIGLSFGYNAQENETHLLSHHKLVSLLLDTVAKNGNLLINIGPKADGTIPKEQESRLLALGEWLDAHGDGIYGTRPYERQHEKTENGVDIYFTKKEKALFVFLDNVPAGDSTIIVKGLGGKADSMQSMDGKKLSFAAQDQDLAVSFKNITPDHFPLGFRVV